MRVNASAFAFLGAGAGLMYVLDPVSGRRRRGRIQDHLHSWRVRTRSVAERLSRSQQRHERRERLIFGKDQRPALGDFDAGLSVRVHAALRQLVRTPQSIEVMVRNGVVTLSGWVHTPEHQPLLETIAALPGVVSVQDELHLKEPPERGVRDHAKRWWPVVAVLFGAAGAHWYTTAD